jgi:ketosteroid isomerase-like protein
VNRSAHLCCTPRAVTSTQKTRAIAEPHERADHAPRARAKDAWIARPARSRERDHPLESSLRIGDRRMNVMTTVRRCALLALLLLGACRATPQPDADHVAAEIEAVCRAQEAAWNRGDLDGFMSAGYLRSDELTFYSGGDVAHGYTAMLERYKKSYQAEGKEMGRLAFTDLAPLPLDDRHALMRGRWKLDFEKRDDVGGLFTLLFVRTSEGWRIVHDHTSVDAPKKKSAAGS